MIKTYRFEIEGLAAGDKTWKTTGRIECEFADAFHAAMKSTFQQLTNGKAVYGKPGLGCSGPYDILSVVIEKEKN